MIEHRTPNMLSSRSFKYATVALAVTGILTASGCTNATGGWFGRGKPKAARDPEPYRHPYNDKYASNTYSPSREDPTAYHPVDVQTGENNDAPADGADSAVNDYVARLQAAADAPDSPADLDTPEASSNRERTGIPWQNNAVAKARPLDRRGVEQQPMALPPRPKEQALPYEAPQQQNPSTARIQVTSQPVVTSAPSVRSVGVRGGNEFARATNPQRTESKPIARTASSNVRAQQGMALDDLSNSRDLEELIDAAKIAVVNDPANPRKQLRLSLLQLANNQPEAAAQLSPAIGHRERELISQFVRSIGNVDNRFSDPLLDTDAVLASIDDLRDSLRDTAELAIPAVALCSRVQTFGIYDEISSSHLRAHQVNRVIVYCEVDHFKSRFDDSSNQFRTELGSHLELFTADGRSVWSQTEDRIVDLSRQQRDDFFLAQLVSFPGNMSSGEYVLKVAITDLQAQKTTEAVHRFEIR